jgi:WD40 repeat protein
VRMRRLMLVAFFAPALASCTPTSAPPPTGQSAPPPAQPASPAVPEAKVLSGHAGNVRELAFSADGKTLVSSADYKVDKTAIVWDVTSGKPRSNVTGGDEGIWSVAVSPDGKTLATGALRLKLWDTATGKESAVIREGVPNGNAEAFSPDGQTLAYGTHTNQVILWDVSAGKSYATWGEGIGRSVAAVAFAPDGKALASGDFEGQVKLWDVAQGKERHTLSGHAHDITRLAFSPDGQLLASGDEFGTVKLWNVATGKELGDLEGSKTEIWALAFTQDGGLLVVGNKGDVRYKSPGRLTFWDVKTRRPRATVPGETHTGAAALSPDGRLLAAGAFDNSIKIWEVARLLEGHKAE